MERAVRNSREIHSIGKWKGKWNLGISGRYLIRKQIESHDDEAAQDDAADQDANQGVDGQFGSAEIGLRQNPAQQKKERDDDNAMRDPVMAGKIREKPTLLACKLECGASGKMMLAPTDSIA